MINYIISLSILLDQIFTMANANVDIVYNAEEFNALSITDRYSDDMSIIFIFEELNLGNSERTRLINDGITSISAMVEQYGYDIKSFQNYLQNLNKIFATAPNLADRVYLSPPVIMQLCGALFYFNHCVNSLHIIPDIMSADGTFLSENYDHFKVLTNEIIEDEEEEEIEIPKLKGHENWVQWRDAFTASLSNCFGARQIPIDYVVNMSDRDAIHGNNAKAEFIAVNLEDEDIFVSKTDYFGPGYKAMIMPSYGRS